MSEWYIQHDEDTEIGPLEPSELLDLVRKGRVTPDTLCRKGESAWFPASKVGGLFHAAHSNVVSYRCPYCNKSVGEPPTYCSCCCKYVDKAIEVLRDANGKKIDAGTFDPVAPRETAKSWMQWVNRLKAQRLERESGARQPKPE